MFVPVLLLCIGASAVAARGKYCCVPDQYQGLEGGIAGAVIQGKPQIVYVGVNISYDFTNQKTAVGIQLTSGGNTTNQFTITDYNKGTQYLIVGEKCTTTTVKGPMMRECIPDTAVEQGVFYYGIGEDILAATSYGIPDGDLTVNAIATYENCVPVAEVIYGTQNGVPVMDSFGFVNMTLGIRNPAVFVPPSFCTQQSTKTQEYLNEPMRHAMNILRRTFFASI